MKPMNLKKPELVKIWKQLDNAYEALEKLEENGEDMRYIDSYALLHYKDRVKTMIEHKSRKPWEGIK